MLERIWRKGNPLTLLVRRLIATPGTYLQSKSRCERDYINESFTTSSIKWVVLIWKEKLPNIKCMGHIVRKKKRKKIPGEKWTSFSLEISHLLHGHHRSVSCSSHVPHSISSGRLPSAELDTGYRHNTALSTPPEGSHPACLYSSLDKFTCKVSNLGNLTISVI